MCSLLEYNFQNLNALMLYFNCFSFVFVKAKMEKADNFLEWKQVEIASYNIYSKNSHFLSVSTFLRKSLKFHITRRLVLQSLINWLIIYHYCLLLVTWYWTDESKYKNTTSIIEYISWTWLWSFIHVILMLFDNTLLWVLNLESRIWSFCFHFFSIVFILRYYVW